MAGKRWFIDWQWGMAQTQFLRYVTNGSRRRFDALWPLMSRTNPYTLLPRIPARNRDKARLVLKIARNPQTNRFGRWTRHPRHEVRSYLRRVRRVDPGAYPFFYVYRLPHDGCAAPSRSWRRGGDRGWNAGGRREARRYRRWIRAFARGLGQRPVAIFLEPDGLAVMECVPKRLRPRRYALMRYAIRKLRRNRNAAIYLDAGASDFGGLSARKMARRLKLAGVGRARGFFLNSTHYDWTRNNLRFGNRISRFLRGKHFVISTAVNGRGPYRLGRPKRYHNELRCNPPGRALGEEPTVRTGSIWADAYLWIGDPGRSGGKCPHPGFPPAPPGGRWWEWYALHLARNASWD
jgi:endoglucanase